MAINVEKLPLANYAVYQLVLQKTEGNVRKFSDAIGIIPQRVNRLFQIDERNGRYPSVSQSIMDAICETYGITEYDLKRPYLDRYVNKENVAPMIFDRNYSHPDIKESMCSEPYNPYVVGSKSGKPFYDVPFQMGYQLPYNDNATNPDYLIDFKPLNRCDFLCRATGDSMFPTICNGDIVAVKLIRDMSASIVNRDIYAIELVNDLRAIKRLVDKGDSFVLVSDNKEYEDQVISKKDVRRIFRVIGSIKVRMF